MASLLYTLWLAPLVAAGAFIVCAYNLELFGGAFHSDAWFALSWGSFPLLAAYLAAAERFSAEALLAACFAGFLSLAQRHLSTQVRTMRRRVAAVDGTIELLDGGREPVTAETSDGGARGCPPRADGRGRCARRRTPRSSPWMSRRFTMPG